MKHLLFLLFFCTFSLLSAQSISELEQQLASAEGGQEKMLLNYQLGEAYLSKDSKKAYEYGRTAHQMATRTNNNSMAAQTAYITAQALLKSREKRDKRNADVWLKSTVKFAKAANDPDLIIKAVDQRSRLAVKDRDYRQAYEINQDVFKYFSQRGGKSISDLDNRFEVQKNKISKERRALEKQVAALESEINNLEQDKSQLNLDKSQLSKSQEKLAREKKEVEEQIGQKEQELESIAEQKRRAERRIRSKEKEVKELTRDALEKQVMIDTQRAEIAETELEAEQSRNLRNLLALIAGFVLLLAISLYSRFRSSRRARKKLEEQSRQIREEQERSDELLLNILPKPIAEQLKEKGKVPAERFNDVTVLFTDFIEFTKISEQLTPEQLVAEIDNCFKGFDFIISQYSSIEKIKTIGDAYMCVSGLSQRRSIPNEIVKAALEMQEFLEETAQVKRQQGVPYFEARIGLHTGPVVAGVVGINKFAYDIWGDTVNIAARMESACESGEVNISESTFNEIRYSFDCQYRGKIQAKNKGMVDMYYVKKPVKAI
ncbi:MAG: adenylate/guanylate cyclase domain-containing protein [Saprospiraceae bacterium]